MESLQSLKAVQCLCRAPHPLRCRVPEAPQQAMEAVRNWKFQRAESGGKPWLLDCRRLFFSTKVNPASGGMGAQTPEIAGNEIARRITMGWDSGRHRAGTQASLHGPGHLRFQNRFFH